jgi:hypothetical protein
MKKGNTLSPLLLSFALETVKKMMMQDLMFPLQ